MGESKKLIYNRVSECKPASYKHLELSSDEKAFIQEGFASRKEDTLSKEEVLNSMEASVNMAKDEACRISLLNMFMGQGAAGATKVEIHDDYHIPLNMPQLLKAWAIHPESALYQNHMEMWQKIHGKKQNEEQEAYRAWLYSPGLNDVGEDEETPDETKKMKRAQMRDEKHRDPEPAAVTSGSNEKTDPIQVLDRAWECAKDKTDVPLERLRVVIENKNSAGSGSRCMGHLLETVITTGPDGEVTSTERLLPSPIPFMAPTVKEHKQLTSHKTVIQIH